LIITKSTAKVLLFFELTKCFGIFFQKKAVFAIFYALNLMLRGIFQPP
jgi:hypothetical protein